MLLLFFIFLFFIGGANGDCKCDPNYATQNYDQFAWPNFWLQNSYDGNTPCVPSPPSCDMLLNSSDPNMGIGGYKQIQWDDTVNGTISLYNSDGSKNKISIIAEGLVRNDLRIPTLKSSTGQFVLVVMNLLTPGMVFVQMDIAPQSAAQTTTTSTIPPPTTAPYNGTLSANPNLISNDLLVMVDQGANGDSGPTGFEASKTFAAAVINKLAGSVVPGVASVSPVTGTRLSLNYLNFINQGPAVAPWIDDAAAVTQQITSLRQMQTTKTDFALALKQLVTVTPSIFNPNNVDKDNTPPADYSAWNSRNTAQRVLLVIASSPPDDGDNIFTPNIDFSTYDIHPIFVAYNFFPSGKVTSLPGLGWQVAIVNDNSDSSVSNFTEEYFLTNSGQGTPLCRIPSEAERSLKAADNGEIIYGFDKEPTDADNYSPKYEKNRYCNFQKISYNIQRSTTRYCVNVFYELEVEKDTLKFYQCDNADDACKGGNYVEYVSLSGTDVAGTRFCFTNSTRIDFSTNESGVYSGFYIQIETK